MLIQQRLYRLAVGGLLPLLGEWLCQLAENSPGEKLLLVAHSYGATLTPRLAMDNPECVSAMLLMAGGSDPELSSPRWYNHLINIAPF